MPFNLTALLTAMLGSAGGGFEAPAPAPGPAPAPAPEPAPAPSPAPSPAPAPSPSPPAYESWSDGVGWFDASDASSLTLSGSSVTAIANKRSGKGNLTGAGTARTYTASAQNGKGIITMARDTTNPARFAAGTTANVSTAFSGNDKPFTTAIVYRVSDANTSVLWGASKIVDGTDSQFIGVVRRAATPSSVRRQVVQAANNDVSFGAGQASGTLHVLVVRHTGTAVTVWDTSVTKAVDAATQDTNTFASDLAFIIGAAYTNASGFINVAALWDFMEMVVQPTARTDAECVQLVQDLAAKWGITL